MALSRLLKSPSAAIFIGMFAGGVGQIVMASAADRFLDDQDFVALMTWNSLFGLISLLIGSPLVALIIVRSSYNQEQDEIKKLEGVALSIGLVVSLAAAIGWYFGGGSFGRENILFPLVLLIFAPFYQVSAASQRGLLASHSKWFGIAVQLGVEGFLRGGLIISFGLLNFRSSNLMIFFSWISTILSVELTYKYFRTYRSTFRPSPISKSIFRLFIPLWISSAAMHLILTLTPNLMSLRSRNVLAIGAISLGLFVLRIPLTLSSTVFTPLIGPMSKAVNNRDALNLFKRTLFFCVAFTFVTVVAMLTFGPFTVGIISNNQLLKSSRLLALLGFSSGLFLFAAALHTYLLARELMSKIAIGWSGTALFFVAGMYFVGKNEQTVGLIVAISSLIAVFLLGFGVKKSITPGS